MKLHPCTWPLLAATALTSACSPGVEDLQPWMQEQRRQTAPRVTPISELKKYVPLVYSESAAADPFDSRRLTQALRRESGPADAGAALIGPELHRRKEPLEAYPLDVMAMVGSLNRGGQHVALVQVDKLLHQVRAGNYLGENHGRVMKVSEGEVILREIVQDAAGEWIERHAVLRLREKTQ